MEKGKHGINEESFDNLSFSGQAKSINGQLRTIEKSINSHIRKGSEENRDIIDIRIKCIEQLIRVIKRL